jgi:uroporphyrinogen decarboxylase
MSLAAEPDACRQLSERLCDLHLANLEKWLGAVGPYIDVILFGDDLGAQGGPLISCDTYRRLFKPFHTKLFHRAKELADVKVQLHCCGGVEPLLGDLIEAGLDAINPVQVSCKGMVPENLKKTYGDRLTFWGGGCDTRHVLSQATPEEVRQNVRGLVDTFAPGGGFVFQQVHNVLADVPPENVVAMLDAVTPQ